MLFHELKTPLTAIILRAQLLEKDIESAKLHLSAIKAAIEHQKCTIHNMSLLGDCEEPTRVNLPSLAAELNALFQPIAEEKRRSLSFSVDGEIATLRRTSTKQILINLITNAIAHSNSQVRVWLEAHNNGAKFIVKDDGPGIPEHMLPHIFEPFFKGSNSHGNGLGLTIAKALTLAQGGTIEACNSLGAEVIVGIPSQDVNSRLE